MERKHSIMADKHTIIKAEEILGDARDFACLLNMAADNMQDESS
jgi:hypothetical protein